MMVTPPLLAGLAAIFLKGAQEGHWGCYSEFNTAGSAGNDDSRRESRFSEIFMPLILWFG
jgi:hypothetical protein